MFGLVKRDMKSKNVIMDSEFALGNILKSYLTLAVLWCYEIKIMFNIKNYKC